MNRVPPGARHAEGTVGEPRTSTEDSLPINSDTVLRLRLKNGVCIRPAGYLKGNLGTMVVWLLNSIESTGGAIR